MEETEKMIRENCKQHTYRVHNQGDVICTNCLRINSGSSFKVKYMTREEFEYDGR